MSYNFENLVFLFIGIGVVGYDLAWNEMGIVLAISSILIVIVARFINIKIVSFILNRYRHDNFIKPNHQKAMWFCGLRGAMAYALALDAADTFKEEGEIILTMTVVIIALNVIYDLICNYKFRFLFKVQLYNMYWKNVIFKRNLKKFHLKLM